MPKKANSRRQREEERTDPRLVALEPPCNYCVHLTELGSLDLSGWTCSAYPDGIPIDILLREREHTRVLHDQEGSDVYQSVQHNFPDGRNFVSFNGEWYK